MNTITIKKSPRKLHVLRDLPSGSWFKTEADHANVVRQVVYVGGMSGAKDDAPFVELVYVGNKLDCVYRLTHDQANAKVILLDAEITLSEAN